MKVNKILPLFIATLTLNSCGQFGPFIKNQSDRTIASAAAEQLIHTNEQNFNEQVNEQLQALHQYNTIGHHYLEKFDQSIQSTDINELYESEAYKALIVTRAMTEEIEDTIIEAYEEFGETASAPEKSREEKIQAMKRMEVTLSSLKKFAEYSETKKSSTENLSTRVHTSLKNIRWPKDNFFQEQIQNLTVETMRIKKLSESPLNSKLEEMFKKEFESYKSESDFAIQQKNIEHLTLLLDVQTQDPAAKIYPTAGKPGNITGNEFPAKVWSLTFDDGPGKASTLEILEHLKKREMKATFFQLAKQVKINPSVSKSILAAGMEIASHSYTHQQLTKVGPIGLEKEITEATKEIEKFYDTDVKFFRLPYGAGVSTASIRNKISDNKLIHVFWNIDTLDWMSQTPDKIVTRTISLMKKTSKDAGIILMHDIHARTAIASAKVMDYLQQDNRRVCTLDEIVTQINEGAAEVCSKK